MVPFQLQCTLKQGETHKHLNFDKRQLKVLALIFQEISQIFLLTIYNINHLRDACIREIDEFSEKIRSEKYRRP